MVFKRGCDQKQTINDTIRDFTDLSSDSSVISCQDSNKQTERKDIFASTLF